MTNRIKEGVGSATELFERLQAEPIFAGVNFDAVTDAKLFVGRSPEQVVEFVDAEIAPIRARYTLKLGQRAELKV